MSTEIVQIMNGWSNNGASNTNLAAAVCVTVAKVQMRDDSWFILASRELGIQEPILRNYATYGNSLSLAVLIHVARQQFNHFGEAPWPEYEFSEILEAASRLNATDTSHDLQHEFCTLWNQVVLKAQIDDTWGIVGAVLRPILDVYTALHQVTDSAPIGAALLDPFSYYYPLCNVLGHRLDSTSHVHNGSTPTSSSRIASLIPASIASPEVPSLSVPTPPHADDSVTGVPPLDDFHPRTAHETTTESLSIPITSPDPAISDEFVTSGIIIPRPTSASPLSSTSPSTALVPLHNVDPLAPSNPPNPPPFAASNPALDNILPTGTPLPSLSSTTRSYPSLSFPGSRHPIMDTVSPGVSPGPPSAPGLGATVEDGNRDPGLRTEEDVIDPPSLNRAIHANDMVTDLPPQSPSTARLSRYTYDIV
ncbi:hypothetical protein EDB84DRAFT_634048 [Lactarius hengduanensis]|nr:hypothetical protein EDB84DRAFT_634048 [Lactarius hengduanensis]